MADDRVLISADIFCHVLFLSPYYVLFLSPYYDGAHAAAPPMACIKTETFGRPASNSELEQTCLEDDSGCGSFLDVGGPLRGGLTLAQIRRYNRSSVQFRPEYYSMKVSLRSTYAIMAAVDMALHADSGPIQAKSIARRQSIPVRFLEQVLHAMKKGGLISSLRGAQGGYVLSRKPSDVSVADVLEALEGPVLHPSVNGRSHSMIKSDALLAKIWARVSEAERRVLEGITIEELAGQQREIEQQRTLMYHI
jgi:Rrf2 family transcriptional regulator, cysteine metabolism repressor